jgi:high-affinity nickel permease
MFGEIFAFTSFAILIGFRHGMDSDHIAAITDMVGAEKERNQQVRMGMMYAVGHGLIVLVLGLLAILVGTHLPTRLLDSMEMVVGVSLAVLGSYILYSLLRSKNDYQHRSRWEIAYQGMRKIFPWKTPNLTKFGMVGSFSVGILHGIGAETPTQVLMLSHSAGLHNLSLSIVQLLLFVIGLLMATGLVTFLASWGFMRARFKQAAYLVLGAITGIYSVVLGVRMIFGV